MSDLIVRNGEDRSIPARTWKYNNIIIERKARLFVPNGSRDWLIFIVKNEFRIDGVFQYKGFLHQDDTTVIARTPSGRELRYTYDMRARGGRGGDGGSPRRANGGSGARGSNEYGGGGGGGGSDTLFGRNRTVTNGLDGDQWRGARIAMDGGNGGRSPRARHGGLVYIECDIISSPTNKGIFYIEGSHGGSGSSGQNGYADRGSSAGGGGGGGGGPSGDGGNLVVNARSRVGEFTFLLGGARGGSAGRGGTIGGREGSPGERGANGRVDWL